MEGDVSLKVLARAEQVQTGKKKLTVKAFPPPQSSFESPEQDMVHLSLLGAAARSTSEAQ
jgi:hypothetical protein